MSNPKAIDWERLTASGLVTRQPSLFYGFCIEPDGSSSTYVDVYDGENTNGRFFRRLRVGANSPGNGDLPFPVKFEKGIYVEFEANCQACTVYWTPLKD